MNTAGRTVLFSGLTVAAAMSSLLVFPQAFLKSMGYGGISAVRDRDAGRADRAAGDACGCSAGGSTPAGCPGAGTARSSVGDDHGWWARLAHGVMRRPVAVIVVTTAVLLAVASPFLGRQVGQRRLPRAARRTLRRTSPPTSSTRSSAAPSSPAPACCSPAPTSRPSRRTPQEVEAVDGIVAVQPVATEGDSTLLRAFWDGNSQTEASPGHRPRPARGRPAEGEVAGRRHHRRHRRPDLLGRQPPAVDGPDRGRRDAGAAVPGLRLGGAADQGDRDERRVDHRVVRHRHLDLPGRAPVRPARLRGRRATSTRPTRS